MSTLLSMSSPMARYLLGDLAPEESQRIEEAIPSNYNLRRELEAAKEELTAAYVVGRLREKDRLKFEIKFLASEEGKRKIKFARAWIEERGSACTDLNSPFHQYLLGQMAPDKADQFEHTLLNEGHQLDQLGAAEDEMLIAYFHETLPRYGKELFEAHYLLNDRFVGKLRFAHIMYEYERASVAPSEASENSMEAGRRRLEKVSRRSHQFAERRRRIKSGSGHGLEPLA